MGVPRKLTLDELRGKPPKLEMMLHILPPTFIRKNVWVNNDQMCTIFIKY